MLRDVVDTSRAAKVSKIMALGRTASHPKKSVSIVRALHSASLALPFGIVG